MNNNNYKISAVSIFFVLKAGRAGSKENHSLPKIHWIFHSGTSSGLILSFLSVWYGSMFCSTMSLYSSAISSNFASRGVVFRNPVPLTAPPSEK